ncbi:MAG: PDZ domain-containing protein [Butyricicoccaceae bacterium]
MGHSKSNGWRYFWHSLSPVPVQAAAGARSSRSGTRPASACSEGVLVVRLDTVKTADGERCPARDAGVREGDIIVSAGGKEVSSNAELQTALKATQGGAVELSIKRGDETHSVQVTACTDQTGVYRLGILARDSMAGIGTLTFADPQTGVSLARPRHRDAETASFFRSARAI